MNIWKAARMKRAFAVFTAVAPVTVLAMASGAVLEDWSYQPLQDDVRVTALLENAVQSVDDQPIGDVRDLLIDAEGNFDAVTVEFNHGDGSAGFAIARLEWSDVTLEAEDKAVTVSIGLAPAQRASAEPVASVEEGVLARDVIGMPVDLADAEDFGIVTDILVDPGTERPSALLVESRATAHALPFRIDAIDTRAERVRYDIPRKAVRQLGDFGAARE